MTELNNTFKKVFHGYAPEDVDVYVTDMRQKLKKAQQDLDDVNEKLKERDSKMTALEKENEGLIADAAEAQDNLSTLQSQNDELTKKYQEHVVSSNQKLNDQTKKHVNAEHELSTQLADVKKQLAEAKANADNSEYRDQVAALTDENEKLQKTNEELSSHNSELQNNNETLLQQINELNDSAMQNANDDALKQRDSEIEKLKNEKKSIEDALNNAKAELASRPGSDEAEVNATIAALQKSVEDYKKEITDLSAKSSADSVNKDAEIDRLKAKLEKASRESKTHQQDLDHLNEQTKAALQNAEQTAKEFGDLKAQLHQAEAENWDLQKQIARLKGERDALKNDLRAVYQSRLTELDADE